MKFRTLLIIIVLLVLVFCVRIFFFSSENNSPKNTVMKFTECLMKSSPSNFDKNALKTAAQQLSTRAKEKINDVFTFANFADIKNSPVKDFNIVEVTEKNDKGIVKAVWDQAGKQVTKIFNLTYEDGKWKIDSIKSYEI